MQGVFHRDLKLVRLRSLVAALRDVAFALKRGPDRSHTIPVRERPFWMPLRSCLSVLQENTLIDRKPSTAPRLKICDFGYSKVRAACHDCTSFSHLATGNDSHCVGQTPLFGPHPRTRQLC